MSSILKVDTIQDQSGNNIINESGNVITIGASGDTITVPAGATLSGDLTGITNLTMTGDLTVDTNTLFVDASANRVGIGTSAPDSPLDILTSGNSGLEVNAGTSSAHRIYLGNTGGTSVVGTLSNHAFATITNGSERARIDASGNLLVGKTSSNTATAGIELRATDQVTITRSGNTGLIVNRLSSDGELVKFQKDGTNIGSIGNNSADFFITNSTATNGAGILLQNNLFVNPMKGGSADTSSSVSLGNSSRKWKDIYLGGGAFLGGTGTANKLDDYEEGTFTPTFTSASASFSYSQQHGFYTKIGRLVTVNIFIRAQSSGTTSNALKITALPFTSINSSGYYASVYFGQIESIDYPSGALEIIGSIGSNNTQIDLQYSRDNAGSLNLPASAIDGATSNGFMVSATYMTA